MASQRTVLTLDDAEAVIAAARAKAAEISVPMALDGMGDSPMVCWGVAGRSLTHKDSWVTEQEAPARPIR
ncbi:hypothetical protein QEN41_21785, partial [Gordonia alkanivorans]|nr:hypothetical protein [Gordonia alkanivorans]